MPRFCSVLSKAPSPDPNDPATKTCTPPPNRDYAQFLKRDSLKGARIGVPRAFYYEAVQLPGEQRTRGGLNAEQQKAMARAIEVLKQQGAEIVDPVVIPSFVDQDPKKNFLLWPYCSGARPSQRQGRDLFRKFQIRNEAGFQSVACQPRSGRAR